MRSPSNTAWKNDACNLSLQRTGENTVKLALKPNTSTPMSPLHPSAEESVRSPNEEGVVIEAGETANILPVRDHVKYITEGRLEQPQSQTTNGKDLAPVRNSIVPFLLAASSVDIPPRECQRTRPHGNPTSHRKTSVSTNCTIRGRPACTREIYLPKTWNNRPFN